MTLNFKYAIGESVLLRQLNIAGRVSIVRHDGFCMEYFTSWWCDGKRFAEWLREDELAAHADAP